MDFLKDFGVNPILLAAQVVNFFILLFILKRFLYGPILKVLAERRKKIEDSLKKAEEIEKRLLQTEEDREKILAEASLQAQKIVDETNKDREVTKEEARIQAERIALQIIKKGEETARAESVRMEQELMGRFAAIVAQAMEKVTGKVLNTKEQKEILEREVKNLS